MTDTRIIGLMRFVAKRQVHNAGVLNGYNMTGWTWASVEDMNALLNKYGGRRGCDAGFGAGAR